LDQHLSKIQELCRTHKMKRLWVFGSILTNEFNEDSDIDFLHEWDEKNISDEEYLDNISQFLSALKQIFKRKIDFVHYPSLKNPYFIKDIDRTKVLLYAKESKEVPV
jgi:predicted nucleotidyltransferase